MKEKGFNINSVFLAIIIALCGWGLKKAADGGEQIASLRTNVENLNKTLMPRPEIESQIANIRQDQLDFRVRLAAIELNISRWQRDKP